MKNELYSQMYEQYKQGFSLSEVGKMFGMTRQSVFEGFKSRKYVLRKKKLLPFIIFNGIKFTLNVDGYYRRTDADRESMHRYVWSFYNGQIPPCHDVHHKNEDKSDNRIENLNLMLKAEHTRQHHTQQVQIKNCLQCSTPNKRRSGESPKAYQTRLFCSIQCSKKWAKGKPRGTKVSQWMGEFNDK